MKDKKSLQKLLVGVFLVFVCIFFINTVVVQADDSLTPELKIKIGTFGTEADFGSDSKVWITKYITALYRYGVGLAAVLAIVMIMVGGFIWLTAAGVPARVEKAKDFISSALLGLLLALFSYVLLNSINPALVELKGLEVETIQSDSNETKVDNCQTESNCSSCQAAVTYTYNNQSYSQNQAACVWYKDSCMSQFDYNHRLYVLNPAIYTQAKGVTITSDSGCQSK